MVPDTQRRLYSAARSRLADRFLWTWWSAPRDSCWACSCWDACRLASSLLSPLSRRPNSRTCPLSCTASPLYCNVSDSTRLEIAALNLQEGISLMMRHHSFFEVSFTSYRKKQFLSSKTIFTTKRREPGQGSRSLSLSITRPGNVSRSFLSRLGIWNKSVLRACIEIARKQGLTRISVPSLPLDRHYCRPCWRERCWWGSSCACTDPACDPCPVCWD